MSFFTKLKKEVGIEENEIKENEKEEEKQPDRSEPIEKKPPPKTKRVKKMNIEEPRILEPTAPKSSEKKGGEWPEKTGELAIDLYQSPDFLVIQSAVAGLKPEDLDITLDNDMLVISGERQKPNQNEEKETPIKYLHQECYWGHFSRKIVLSEEVDMAKAEAVMKQGVLTIKLPRVHKQKIKKITVREE